MFNRATTGCKLLLLILISTALGWLPPVGATIARAEGKSSEEPPEEAIQFYRQGRQHYKAGRYEDAIVDLKAALELDPDSPNLMYNVARVSELLGNLNEAIDYYRRYLKTLPGSETEERERIRTTITRLEGARQAVVAQATEDKQTLRAPSWTPGPRKPLGEADLWFWTAAGTGAVLLIGGAVSGVLALKKEDQVADFVVGETADGSLMQRYAMEDQAVSLALASDILAGAGVAALTAAALLFFLRDPEVESETPRASVATNGGNTMLTLAGSF